MRTTYEAGAHATGTRVQIFIPSVSEIPEIITKGALCRSLKCFFYSAALLPNKSEPAQSREHVISHQARSLNGYHLKCERQISARYNNALTKMNVSVVPRYERMCREFGYRISNISRGNNAGRVLFMTAAELWPGSSRLRVETKHVNYLSHITTRHEPVRLKAPSTAHFPARCLLQKPADRGETRRFPFSFNR